MARRVLPNHLVLESQELTKVYQKKVTAVDSISFGVRKGEVFGLLGSNGAGKSTTLKIFAGLLAPTSGQALLKGRSVHEKPLWAKARIGFVPESPVLYETLTGREFLDLVGTLRKMSPEEVAKRIETLAKVLEVGEALDHQLGTYSKGMRQKVVVASAFLHDPAVLLLDEPTSGLDPRYGKIVKQWIVEFAQRGGTVLLSTHHTTFAEEVCTRVGVIHNGKLLETGSPRELGEKHGVKSLEDAFVKIVGGEAWAPLPSFE